MPNPKCTWARPDLVVEKRIHCGQEVGHNGDCSGSGWAWMSNLLISVPPPTEAVPDAERCAVIVIAHGGDGDVKWRCVRSGHSKGYCIASDGRVRGFYVVDDESACDRPRGAAFKCDMRRGHGGDVCTDARGNTTPSTPFTPPCELPRPANMTNLVCRRPRGHTAPYCEDGNGYSWTSHELVKVPKPERVARPPSVRCANRFIGLQCVYAEHSRGYCVAHDGTVFGYVPGQPISNAPALTNVVGTHSPDFEPGHQQIKRINPWKEFGRMNRGDLHDQLRTLTANLQKYATYHGSCKDCVTHGSDCPSLKAADAARVVLENHIMAVLEWIR